MVITMRRGDACPFFPASATWTGNSEDPAGKDTATVRRIRDIDGRVRALLGELLPHEPEPMPAARAEGR